MTDFSSLTNEEYYRLNGTLSPERIEALLSRNYINPDYVSDAVDCLRELITFEDAELDADIDKIINKLEALLWPR